MTNLLIYFGPYEAHGICVHRIQRISGLIKALEDLDYEFQVIKFDVLNVVQIEMCQRLIFQCDIRNLKFNIPIEQDTVCQRAVEAIEEAKSRMDIDHPSKFPSIFYGKRYFAGIHRSLKSVEKKSTQRIIPETIPVMYHSTKSMEQDMKGDETNESNSY